MPFVPFALDTREELVAGIRAIERGRKTAASSITYPTGGGMTTKPRDEAMADLKAMYWRLGRIDGIDYLGEAGDTGEIALVRVVPTTGY